MLADSHRPQELLQQHLAGGTIITSVVINDLDFFWPGAWPDNAKISDR